VGLGSFVSPRTAGTTDHDEGDEMSVLHLICDGTTTAAGLLALLFIAPVEPAGAAEPAWLPAAAHGAPTPSGASSSTLRSPAEQRLHLVDAALEMRFLGLLADVRIVQTVRNDSAQAVDLGKHLPAADTRVDSLSVTRDGHTVDLLASAGCGGEHDSDSGRVRPSEDEFIAELMQLPAGRQATVKVSATENVWPAGSAWRVALPATVEWIRAQALLVARSTGGHVVVIPPADAVGTATVTLRPASGSSSTVELGRIEPGFAYVVPVVHAEALAQLGEGAIELEVVGAHDIRWMTLEVSPRPPGPAALIRAAD
jgi:hypothetical protein